MKGLVQLPDGQKAELGATWLHGIDGHPVYDLAVEYGLMPAQKPNGMSGLVATNKK